MITLSYLTLSALLLGSAAFGVCAINAYHAWCLWRQAKEGEHDQG